MDARSIKGQHRWKGFSTSFDEQQHPNTEIHIPHLLPQVFEGAYLFWDADPQRSLVAHYLEEFGVEEASSSRGTCPLSTMGDPIQTIGYKLRWDMDQGGSISFLSSGRTPRIHNH